MFVGGGVLYPVRQKANVAQQCLRRQVDNLVLLHIKKKCVCLRRFDPHTCGHPSASTTPPPAGATNCSSLLPMFKLLVRLGANLEAVDECGCNWLAAAAAAGDYGLWDLLGASFVAMLDRLRPNQVLHRAAQYSCRPGARVGFFSDALQCLQQQYAARGASEDFLEDLSRPAADLVSDGKGGWHLESAHVLLAAIVGSQGAQVHTLCSFYYTVVLV